MKSGVFRVCVFFFYLLALSQVACSQENTRLPVPVAGDSIETDASERRFRIYRDALQQGSVEEIRIDAAVGLMLQDNEQGRGALLSALKSVENPQARQAVCKALIKSRGLSQTIGSIEVFRAPLLMILQSESTDQAKLAAETLLLFTYSDIAEFLDNILKDQELDRRIRINAVYALQLRTEPKALRDLIKLLDDPDADVVKAAETALQEAFGIPVGASRVVWSGILDELQRKSPDDIRRERLLRQEMNLRQVQAERDRWQKLYLSSLDKQYELQPDDAKRNMVLEMMVSDMYPVRLWALDKATKYPVIGDELSAKLLALLSDSSQDVRLEAAKALMNMSKLNPAAVLLERLQLEEYPEVKLAMLEALGEACFYAFSEGSGIDLPEEIKFKTLEIASGYLQSESGTNCIKGAEVIRKILETKVLDVDSVQSYLDLLNERYEKSCSQKNGIRAELLSILAHLCGQGGAKDAACALFGPLFTDAMSIENDPALRFAAVQGLSYVDKVRALELFKQYNLTRDSNPGVLRVVVDVAGKTGDAADLEWLVKLLNGNGQSEGAWSAIKSICQRQTGRFLLNWLSELEGSGFAKDEYIRDIFDIAELKAAGEQDENLLKQVREKVISYLVERKAWEQAVAYLSQINYTLSDKFYSDKTDFEAFTAFLYSGIAEKAAKYTKTRVGVSDLEQDSVLATVISRYFSDKEVSDADKMRFFNIISVIPKEGKTNWAKLVNDIGKQLELIAAQPSGTSDEGAEP